MDQSKLGIEVLAELKRQKNNRPAASAVYNPVLSSRLPSVEPKSSTVSYVITDLALVHELLDKRSLVWKISHDLKRLG